MPEPRGRSHAEGVYVAGMGVGPRDGLHRFLRRGAQWEGEQLAMVDNLLALAWHPVLPVVYGLSGLGREGLVHVWDVSGEGAVALGETPSGGAEPCHVAISPGGELLVVANYATGSLRIWPLGEEGSLLGAGEGVELKGASVDPERQEGSHPHHVSFHGGLLRVIDLGADLVRTFAVSANGGGAVVTPVRETTVPAGTGPRHGVTLPGGEVVLSGELASTVLAGGLDDREGWYVSSSTERTARAMSERPRNYPGDIQRSDDGRYVYVANRGLDTISTLAVGQGAPRLVSEVDSGVVWPQHLLVSGSELLVAGRGDSRVVALALDDGLPGDPRTLFDCAAACWLLPLRRNRL
ncbi:lactonase family protein [Leifsonia bigeumensis]|uniref:Lactonase family protein n=1 Tax=Leifsonella bigeumensis TaxID=433643 RepID=A0ABP7F609_9MICO